MGFGNNLRGLPASGPLRGTAGQFGLPHPGLNRLTPPRGRPVGGGGVHRTVQVLFIIQKIELFVMENPILFSCFFLKYSCVLISPLKACFQAILNATFFLALLSPIIFQAQIFMTIG